MIGQYLSNKNESATVAKFEIFSELNKAQLKGPNMARGGVNSLFKNSTNSLEQEVSK